MKDERETEKAFEKTHEKTLKKRNKKPFIIAAAVIVILLTVIYLSVSVYFQYHFFMGSTINGVDVSFMTADEAAAVFKNRARTYYLEIKERNGKIEHISAEDAGVKMLEDFNASPFLEEQNPYKWLFNIKGTHTYIDMTKRC